MTWKDGFAVVVMIRSGHSMFVYPDYGGCLFPGDRRGVPGAS